MGSSKKRKKTQERDVGHSGDNFEAHSRHCNSYFVYNRFIPMCWRYIMNTTMGIVLAVLGISAAVRLVIDIRELIHYKKGN
jgi:hypothetical protein